MSRNFKPLLEWLKQPSTVRGIIQLGAAVGVVLNPVHVVAIVIFGTGAVALSNLFKKDDSHF